jgi:hypothetical protein
MLRDVVSLAWAAWDYFQHCLAEDHLQATSQFVVCVHAKRQVTLLCTVLSQVRKLRIPTRLAANHSCMQRIVAGTHCT